jgi:WD40 repeat protein
MEDVLDENPFICEHCNSSITGGITVLDPLLHPNRYSTSACSFIAITGLGNGNIKMYRGIEGDEYDNNIQGDSKRGNFVERISLFHLNSACTSIDSDMESTVVASSLQGQLVEILVKDDKNQIAKVWSFNGTPTATCVYGSDVIVAFEAGHIKQLRAPIDEPLWKSSKKLSVEGIAILDRELISVGSSGFCIHDMRKASAALTSDSSSQERFAENGLSCVAVNRNTSHRFATGDFQGRVTIWDARKLSQGALYTSKHHKGITTAVAFNPNAQMDEVISVSTDGKCVALASDGKETVVKILGSLRDVSMLGGKNGLLALAQDDGTFNCWWRAPSSVAPLMPVLKGPPLSMFG